MRRLMAMTVLTATAALALTACGTDTDEPETDTEPPASQAAQAPDELTDAVLAIAPDADPDEIFDNSENVCLDIEQGKDDEALARNAALRFGIDEGDAPALVEAIRPHCEAIR